MLLRSVYFGIIQFPFCDTKRIVKKRERVSKSVLCANATKRIVPFPDRLSTIHFVSTKRIVEKVAPQTVLLNSGEERGVSSPTADLKRKVGRRFSKIAIQLTVSSLLLSSQHC